MMVGQLYNDKTKMYSVYRSYLEFSTSSLSGSTILTATLYLKLSGDTSDTDFMVRIYDYNWLSPLGGLNRETNYDGPLITAADTTWRSTYQISLNTYYSASVMTTSINTGGNSHYALLSWRDVNNTSPVANEYVTFYSGDTLLNTNRPYLNITYIPASPFLYTQKNTTFTKYSDFIAGATSPEKEYTSNTNITGIDIVNDTITLKIKEELNETTYLNRIFLRVNNKDIIYPTMISTGNLSMITRSDTSYLILNKGDEAYLTFSLPYESITKIEFAAQGYYIKH